MKFQHQTPNIDSQLIALNIFLQWTFFILHVHPGSVHILLLPSERVVLPGAGDAALGPREQDC